MFGHIYFKYLVVIVFVYFTSSCQAELSTATSIKTGAEQIDQYIDLLKGKKVGLLINHTSKINNTLLLDTLLSLQVSVKKIFVPEHGFRGNKSNGELIINDIDTKTGIPIFSLYGNNKKPSIDQLADLDIVIYDIQDVGARFYTYISTMHYMMESCADAGVQLIILDRPNPNGGYIDGPVLEIEFSSFVGMHPIPIVYGMTAGELAQMISGEKWLKTDKKLSFQVIPLQNWQHSSEYHLPVAPSPNLPSDKSIEWYPSLCLFEGTDISIGRGTDSPFTKIGFPDPSMGSYTFTPISIVGASENPKHLGKTCYGVDLSNQTTHNRIELSYIIDFYQLSKNKVVFFTSFFTKLAGTKSLQSQIEQNWTEQEIRASWKSGLDDFNKKRLKYLIYD